ncbi:MAG TPA: glycosyltransferase family 2 protein [Thermoleophilaceae bacterium]|nr:glycosyltransferase family 2 protein [Thermoleophilaceae bacterium]
MPLSAAFVIPCWNGRRWLDGCLDSLLAQTRPADELIVVDNGSTDGSAEHVRERFPQVRVLELPNNSGFAGASNVGLRAVSTDTVALINQDVRLEADWLERSLAALDASPGAASVATKMLDMGDPSLVYDAGDILRRDGVCEQRGRFERDDGRFDRPGDVFGACAGAALYRREPVLELGGFDERFFLYLEDADLALRLRLAGWTCVYEPAVALHAGEGSGTPPERPVHAWAERNTLLLVARAFPWRWLPLVAWRQAGWTWHAARAGRLRAHLRGATAALPLLPAMWRERRALREAAVVPVESAVPAHSLRGHSWAKPR